MARPVDPALRRARRLQIIDAGLTAFAEHGPGATTAQICSLAGIGSGTFFHHFPTKDALVLAILELGTQELREFFAGQRDAPSPRAALHAYADRIAEDLADPRAAGFILAVGAMTARAAVVAALDADQETTRQGLLMLLGRAQAAAEIRTDVPADRLAAWMMMLSEGLAAGVAGGYARAAEDLPLLHEQLDALLDGPGGPGVLRTPRTRRD
ncbi:TetR/AcrR family transcriptional regulator [Brachybacterium hainanense]|uniref:TetR/AcrR family transcriptional regulator n=1 Tax=Brachybacterium hainanense TaxID=1541174 RepID=A0ABV6RGS3_9MICO